MRFVVIALQVLFGLPILAFGIFGLIWVMPDPHEFLAKSEGFTEPAKACLLSMWDSHFLMPSICVVHVIAGALAISNRFVPFALAIHLPVSLQMFLFHLVLDVNTGFIAFGTFTLNLVLIYCYRDAFLPLLKARNKVLQKKNPADQPAEPSKDQ